MSEEILVARDGGLGRLTLNRPQALHALTTVLDLHNGPFRLAG